MIVLAPTDTHSWAGAPKALCSVLKADSLRGRFARGAVWSLIAAIISQVSSLAASVIAARILGREQFGEYGMVQSTVAMLGVFAGMGLGMTTTKYVAELRVLDRERAGRIIALGSLVACVSGGLLAFGLVAHAEWLAAKSLNSSSLANELRIASLILFFNAFNGSQTGTLAGFEAFRIIARVNLTRGLLTFPITLGLGLAWKLPGAMWALAISSAVGCVLSHFSLQHICASQGICLQYSRAWSERQVLWTFSVPALLSSAMVGGVTWAANTMLVHQPNGYAEMGIFSAASQWRYAIGFIPGVMAQSMLPLLSSLNGKRDAKRYQQALRWNLLLATAAAMSVAVPVALGAPYIMRLYGRDFQQGWPVLVLSAATAVISCINGVVGTAIVSAGSVWVGFVFNFLWASVLLCGCSYLIPLKPAVGLAGSMLTAYIAHTVWQGLYFRHYLTRSLR